MEMIRFERIFDLSTGLPDLAWLLLLDDSKSHTSWSPFRTLPWYFPLILDAKSNEPECFWRFLKVRCGPVLPRDTVLIGMRPFGRIGQEWTVACFEIISENIVSQWWFVEISQYGHCRVYPRYLWSLWADSNLLRRSSEHSPCTNPAFGPESNLVLNTLYRRGNMVSGCCLPADL